MATTEVVYYQETNGTVPLNVVRNAIAEGYSEVPCQLGCLEEMGHELRRPEADYLRDEIYELRASYQGVHYRMLYFFHGRNAVVVSHGFAKERAVPPREIDLAMRRKTKFEEEPERHRFRP